MRLGVVNARNAGRIVPHLVQGHALGGMQGTHA